MLPALALVLVSIAIGDLITAALAAPIPGSVLGLIGAAAYFASRGGPTPAMSGMFDALIPYAPMLFVPAGAGVVANLDLIATSWLPIIAVITLGTAGARVCGPAPAQSHRPGRGRPMISSPLEVLAGHPLFDLALTIGVYLGAMRLYRVAGGNPLLTPVLISVVVVGTVIAALLCCGRQPVFVPDGRLGVESRSAAASRQRQLPRPPRSKNPRAIRAPEPHP